jgi:hypothetical protein
MSTRRQRQLKRFAAKLEGARGPWLKSRLKLKCCQCGNIIPAQVKLIPGLPFRLVVDLLDGAKPRKCSGPAPFGSAFIDCERCGPPNASD